MSRPFAKYSGKPAFSQVKECLTSGDYLKNKKSLNMLCNKDLCKCRVNSSGNQLLKLQALINSDPCLMFKKNSLYKNLYTKLDLNKYGNTITTMSNLSNNAYPIYANSSSESCYGTVNIDPNGNLFGNSVCGIDNFNEYVAFNRKTIV